MKEVSEKDIENLMHILDGFAESDTGRLKVFQSEDLEEGSMKRQYHHGRCDIGSPWEKGLAFDVLESEE